MRPRGAAATGAVAAAGAVTLALGLLSSGGRIQPGSSTAFIVATSATGTSVAPAPAASSVAVASQVRLASPSRAATPSSAGRHVLGAAAALVAAVALATFTSSRQRTQGQRGVRIGMRARGQNFFRPNAKGSKPMINRPITRNLLKESMEGWVRKYRTADSIEDIMKKTIYGRVQFQFASEHFTDEIPLISLTGQTGRGRRMEDQDDHDDVFMKRKYYDPAKFKKLAIANWEMPAAATRTVTLQDLVQAGMQYGHNTGIWNPKMLKYLYTEYDGNHIFDLVQTAACMNRACYYVMEAAAKGAVFLFAGTKQQSAQFIKEAALRTGMPYCDSRFVGGLLSNFQQVRKGVQKMKTLRLEREQGAWKVESAQVQEKKKLMIGRLIRKYQGVVDMTELPDILICIDEVKERHPINEATRLGIPVVCLCDSNSDPTFIDLPIPGNASGTRSIDLVIGKLTEAIIRGQGMRNMEKEGEREVIEKEWDPWIFSKDRLRYLRRRSKRQPWHKVRYGGYEQWKKAHPFGKIPAVAPFDPQFNWKV